MHGRFQLFRTLHGKLILHLRFIIPFSLRNVTVASRVAVSSVKIRDAEKREIAVE